ncbi:MAG TPA: hypothetical protein VGD63_10310 [Steroidobacteraceae bacterium]
MPEPRLLEGAIAEQFYTLAMLVPTLCWMAGADGWIFWHNSRSYEFTGTTLNEMQVWGGRAFMTQRCFPEWCNGGTSASTAMYLIWRVSAWGPVSN